MTVENIVALVARGAWKCWVVAGLDAQPARALISIAISIAALCIPFAYLGLGLRSWRCCCHSIRCPGVSVLQRRDTWPRWGCHRGSPTGLTWPAGVLAVGPAAFILNYTQEPIHYLIAAIVATPWCLLIWRTGFTHIDPDRRMATALVGTVPRRSQSLDHCDGPQKAVSSPGEGHTVQTWQIKQIRPLQRPSPTEHDSGAGPQLFTYDFRSSARIPDRTQHRPPLGILVGRSASPRLHRQLQGTEGREVLQYTEVVDQARTGR